MLYLLSITVFNTGGIAINNYVTYPSALSTGVLSVTDYATIKTAGTGYVLIQDGGQTYQLNFDIVEETN